MHIIRTSIKGILFLFFSFCICLIGLYTYAYLSPKLDLKKSGSLYIYDNANQLIYQGSSTNEWVDIKDISPDLINAMIAVEDKNFYKHQGFDYLRIAKAIYLNIKNKNIVQGASTISQQYIKNLYLDFDQTWQRKIEEAFLTLELEVHYDKKEILEGYLNTINFGQGNYGVVNAANYYFNKKTSDLSLEESIILAGIPKNPSKYNPISNYSESLKRAKVVARAMVKNNYLSKEEYKELFKSDIKLYGKRKEHDLQMLMYYQDAVLNELDNINIIPKDLIKSGGLKIYTTLDLDTQEALENTILSNITDEEVQVASVIVDPQTGAVMALTGGMDYSKSQYNRALYSKRQVGSTMKPFLYYAALENNMTMASTFTSEPTTFNLANNKTYSPKNASNIYGYKPITMAAAIAYSENIYAVKTNMFLGVDKMIEVAHRTGIKEKLPENASLPLGTTELNILDFAAGYTTFASGGYEKELYFISKVEDLDGNVLYEKKENNKLVLNPNYTYILNEMLANTTNSAFLEYNTPTALSIAGKLSQKYAIKTGTSNNDYWIVGYNNSALMMLWAGYDEGKSVNASNRKEAKNIWAETIEQIKSNEYSWYETPKNVIGVPLDAISGQSNKKNGKTVLYYFIKGSEPNYKNESYAMEETNTNN